MAEQESSSSSTALAGAAAESPPREPLCIKLFGAKISAAGCEEAAASPGAKPPASGLACPRCRSRETKFCYFNNYNVNQPRHYCRGCQRYWTAGGALRNVPVGAGRRKGRSPPRDAFALEGSVVQHLLFPTKRPNKGIH